MKLSLCGRLQERRHGAAGRIEQHDPALVIGDEHAAVAVNLQPVRPAIILGHKLPRAIRADTEDASIGNVGDVQPALPIEGRPFEEGVDLTSTLVGIRPGGAARLSELIRKPREDGGLDPARRVEECHGATFGKP